MSDFFIAPIVEGHGEVQAVPNLLHRIVKAHASDIVLRVNQPIRVKAASFRGDVEYFSRYVKLAIRKVRAHPGGAVLILLDCDDECPAKLGPELCEKAARLGEKVEVAVALACREYETWFLAAAKSLRGVAGLRRDLEPPAPESIRDAKGWLHQRMVSGYNEPLHQLTLTERFSLEEADAIPSFHRLRRRLQALFNQGPKE